MADNMNQNVEYNNAPLVANRNNKNIRNMTNDNNNKLIQAHHILIAHNCFICDYASTNLYNFSLWIMCLVFASARFDMKSITLQMI